MASGATQEAGGKRRKQNDDPSLSEKVRHADGGIDSPVNGSEESGDHSPVRNRRVPIGPNHQVELPDCTTFGRKGSSGLVDDTAGRHSSPSLERNGIQGESGMPRTAKNGNLEPPLSLKDCFVKEDFMVSESEAKIIDEFQAGLVAGGLPTCLKDLSFEEMVTSVKRDLLMQLVHLDNSKKAVERSERARVEAEARVTAMEEEVKKAREEIGELRSMLKKEKSEREQLEVTLSASLDNRRKMAMDAASAAEVLTENISTPL